MDTFFIGTILPWTGYYAPQGWAYCRGQPMSVQQYTALFALIGTRYGGDGRTSFNLPNLQGRLLMGAPDVTSVAKVGGQAWAPVTMPALAHSHTASGPVTASLSALAGPATTDKPGATTCIAQGKKQSGPNFPDANLYTNATTPDPVDVGKLAIAPPAITAVAAAGNANPSSVAAIPPVLALDYIICLSGVYPPFD